MERTALVTGSPERVHDVEEALTAAGFDVVSARSPSELAARGAHRRPASIDCYVQLPIDPHVESASPVERLRTFLVEGLVGRFDAASAVLPLLKPGAVVVLVGGNRLPLTTPDDHEARMHLLSVLAHAIRSEPTAVEVRTILLDPRRSPAEIAQVAATGRPLAAGSTVAPRGGAEEEYDDWRLEVLSAAPPGSNPSL